MKDRFTNSQFCFHALLLRHLRCRHYLHYCTATSTAATTTAAAQPPPLLAPLLLFLRCPPLLISLLFCCRYHNCCRCRDPSYLKPLPLHSLHSASMICICLPPLLLLLLFMSIFSAVTIIHQCSHFHHHCRGN